MTNIINLLLFNFYHAFYPTICTLVWTFYQGDWAALEPLKLFRLTMEIINCGNVLISIMERTVPGTENTTNLETSSLKLLGKQLCVISLYWEMLLKLCCVGHKDSHHYNLECNLCGNLLQTFLFSFHNYRNWLHPEQLLGMNLTVPSCLAMVEPHENDLEKSEPYIWTSASKYM
jgi:hypothetical protein